MYANDVHHDGAGIAVSSEAGGEVRNVRIHDNGPARRAAAIPGAGAGACSRRPLRSPCGGDGI